MVAAFGAVGMENRSAGAVQRFVDQDDRNARATGGRTSGTRRPPSRLFW
jgi:hypothetical protein